MFYKWNVVQLKIRYLYLPYFQISNNHFYFAKYPGTLLSHRRSLHAFYEDIAFHMRHLKH